jgi:hypothetical protein
MGRIVDNVLKFIILAIDSAPKNVLLYYRGYFQSPLLKANKNDKNIFDHAFVYQLFWHNYHKAKRIKRMPVF